MEVDGKEYYTTEEVMRMLNQVGDFPSSGPFPRGVEHLNYPVPIAHDGIGLWPKDQVDAWYKSVLDVNDAFIADLAAAGKIDKATPEEVVAGTNNDKSLTPMSVVNRNDPIDKMKFYRLKQSVEGLESIVVNGRHEFIRRDEVLELIDMLMSTT